MAVKNPYALDKISLFTQSDDDLVYAKLFNALLNNQDSFTIRASSFWGPGLVGEIGYRLSKWLKNGGREKLLDFLKQKEVHRLVIHSSGNRVQMFEIDTNELIFEFYTNFVICDGSHCPSSFYLTKIRALDGPNVMFQSPWDLWGWSPTFCANSSHKKAAEDSSAAFQFFQ